jgi:hypothetical protein
MNQASKINGHPPAYSLEQSKLTSCIQRQFRENPVWASKIISVTFLIQARTAPSDSQVQCNSAPQQLRQIRSDNSHLCQPIKYIKSSHDQIPPPLVRRDLGMIPHTEEEGSYLRWEGFRGGYPQAEGEDLEDCLSSCRGYRHTISRESELLSMYWLSFERDSRAAPRPARRITNKSLYPNSDPACKSTVQFPLRSELSESHHNQVSPDSYLFPPRLSSVL